MKGEKQVVFFGGGGAWTGTYMYFILHDPDDPAIDEFFFIPSETEVCVFTS